MSVHAAAPGLSDTKSGYGLVSRSLHWLMAMLFVWQFASALLRVFARDTPLTGFFWSTHYSVGFTICVLALLRGAWGLINLERRPSYDGGLLGRAASAAHLSMYVLMIVVPVLAILRAVGSGRGLTVYGVELVARGGEANPMLTAPANAAHGLFGWTLLALIVGHIAMALLHGLVWRDPALDRMTKGWSAKPAPATR